MARFVAHVPLRWTDQDAYRHLNHARAVTLLEEARIDLFFDAASASGVGGFATGLLVVELGVRYRRQITYRPEPLLVEMWVDQVRAASFRISYALHDGASESDPVAIEATTGMALFDLESQRPRRITGDERAFLEKWGEA
ncbi:MULTISPECIES: thioesterase family protein [unclassified Pseudonocardia]|uniref:acyl-CoA thioesterase n=1 Tax=unclassified Pseudonocardia TaxID=2619320 RepID=UPI00095BB4C7|nr:MULTISPECIES: thioesterase family protein [unclassified Pseudonocardia]MBN9101364.1 thioesterase family protein [Pseudonocardia sp.]OJY42392.1 MAG: thioesterase [Pseudonocardia sp. 73-21]